MFVFNVDQYLQDVHAHRNPNFQHLLKMCCSAGLKFSCSNISQSWEITGHFGQGVPPISHSQFPSLIATCLVSMGHGVCDSWCNISYLNKWENWKGTNLRELLIVKYIINVKAGYENLISWSINSFDICFCLLSLVPVCLMC